MVMCINRFVIVLSIFLLLFVLEPIAVQGGSHDTECNADGDCGENASCNSGLCECEVGFFDLPPITLALNEGCLGECDELGDTNQCEGNTQCTMSPLGYGVCTCPSETYGPPQCLDDCESNLQCNLRGNCENGHCVCFSGFEGKHCEVIRSTTTETTKKNGMKLPLLLGAAVIPLLFLVPAGFVSAMNPG